MAINLKFLRGQSAGINSVDIKDGQLLFTIDNGHIYLDNGDTTRVEFYKTDLAKITNDITTINAKIATLTGDSEGAGSITDAILAEIAKLDVEDVETEGQYIASVSETDGKITVTRKALPNYDNTYAPKAATQEAIDNINNKIGKASVQDGEPGSGIIKDIEDVNTEVASLKTLVGTTTSSKSLADQIKTNTDAIGVLNGTEEGSVKKTVDVAINEFATKVSNDNVVNTYKELIDYAAANGSQIITITGDITALKDQVGKKASEGQVATGLEKAVADNVSAISAETTRAQAAESQTLTNAKAYTDTEVAKVSAALEWGSFGETATSPAEPTTL